MSEKNRGVANASYAPWKAALVRRSEGDRALDTRACVCILAITVRRRLRGTLETSRFTDPNEITKTGSWHLSQGRAMGGR